MFDKSLIRNYFYNSGLNILNMIFPIISFPYISRVLGVEGLGEASFILIFSGYFITLTALGIPIYGIREIAKIKTNKIELNKLFSELFLLNFVNMIIFSFIYLLIIYNFSHFENNITLYLLIGINIIFSFFQIDWLFQGLENYKIITIRSFIAKLLAYILMIIFVNNKGDIDIYLITNIIALTGANLFNIFYARKYINITFKNLDFKRHFEPIIYFFSTRVMGTIYTVLDTVILSLLVGNFYVGLYIAAIRLNRAVASIIASLSAVLLPKSSQYLEDGKGKEYKEVTVKSLYFIILLSSSIAIFLFLFASDIMSLFAGAAFNDAVLTMQILTIIIITVSLSNFTGMQILYPNKKEKIVAKSIALGAMVNLTLNFILIPIYKHNGAAIATVIAELVILYYQYRYIKKTFDFNFDKKRIVSILFGIFLCLIIVYMLNQFVFLYLNIYLRLPLGIFSFIIIYFFIFYIIKEKIIVSVINKIKG
jgi:O-antigen/teichoic acid export membrane protein